MNATVAKIARETNWPMISVLGGFALSAITAFASIKSDIRDLSTQLQSYRSSSVETDQKLSKLYDLFIENTFQSIGKGKP